MSVPFYPAKTPTNTTSAGDAAATGALPSFSFGATGAGDAGKGMPAGLNAMATPMQNKPGGLFGAGINTTPVQNTGFSFGTPTAAPGISGAPLGTPVAQTQSPGLGFGGQPNPHTGISFGTVNTAAPAGFSAAAPAGFSAAAPAGFSAAAPAGFSAAAPAGFSAAAPAGFSAAAPAGFSAAAPAATTGFNLGGPIAATTAPAPGLSFGVTKPATTTGFSLGGGEATAPAGGSGLTFGTPNAMTTGAAFNLGSTLTTTTASTTATTVSGFGLGSSTTTTTAAGIPLDAAKTSTVQTGFSLAPTTATLQPDSGFGTSTANTTATAAGFALPGTGTATGTTSTATGFGFGGGPTATTASGFSLNKTVSGAPTASLAAPATQLSLGTTTTVTSSASSTQPAAINFFQLEESINKWTLELEEQEKVFVNQASQINAWDKLLITNGEKIVTLNQEVERVKIEQQQLEHELDYVVGQQKELQDCLVPLEKELASLSVSDSEREYTYRLAENLDTQLKQMSEDLKEIIEHLNEANRTQDSSDPIVQIGKILNAHMNSLQWLDQQTTLLSQKIQQIDQMHQNFRQENERSFNLAYN